MILLLGMLSLVQLLFLPGYLILRCLRVGDGLLRTMLFSFALSLTANHLMVLGLVAIGGYLPAVLYGVFAVECLALIWITRHDQGTLKAALRADVERATDLVRSRLEGPPGIRAAVTLVVALAVGTIIVFAYYSLKSFGDVFMAWDAVLSWSRWARHWAANGFARSVYTYPQLVPATWSVTYVFMGGHDIECFAKWIMSLFPLGLLLVQADLALRFRRLTYLAAVPITGWILYRMVTPLYMFAGYADIPVAFMALASCYALLVAFQSSDPEVVKREVLLGALLVGGCVLTKQPGVLVAAAYLVVLIIYLRRSGVAELASKKWRLVFYAGGLMAIVSLPWYLYMAVHLHDTPDGTLLTEYVGPFANGDRITFAERFLWGIHLLKSSLGLVPLVVVLGLACVGTVVDKVWRPYVLLIVIPWTCVWAVMFNYDLRNLFVVLPFVAIAVAAGARSFAQLGLPLLALAERHPRLAAGAAICAVAAAVAVVGRHYDVERFAQAREYRRKSAMYGIIYDLDYLIRYYDSSGFNGTVLTNRKRLLTLAGLQDCCEFDPMTDVAAVERRIGRGDIRYIVAMRPALDEFISKQTAAGAFKTIHESDFHQFVEVVPGQSVSAAEGP